MTDRSQEEIKAKLTEVLERETERGNRLKFLLQVVETSAHALEVHDLHRQLAVAGGMKQGYLEVMDKTAAPFRAHLQLLKSALDLYREAAEGPEKQPEEPPDETA